MKPPPPQPPPQVLQISDLLRHHHPISATSSLHTSPSPSPSHPPPFPTPSPNLNPSTSSSQFLHSLSSPTTLTGTLSLPSSPSHSCLQFSDTSPSSCSLCCDILNFHPGLLNYKIRVLSWNFIPLLKKSKHSNCGPCRGLLEIIKWELFENNSIPPLNSIKLVSSNNYNNNNEEEEEEEEDFTEVSHKARHAVSGVVGSVSPVTLVSCSGNEGGVESFIVEILSCECQPCVEKKRGGGGRGKHRYVKSSFVYFSGVGIVAWHTVFRKMVGEVIGLSGLKKKVVHLGKEEEQGQGQLMFVVTKATCLQRCDKLRNGEFSVGEAKGGSKRRGELGVYVGVVKGVYVQGVIVELDDDVMLLLTDKSVFVPHSLRVGAVVSWCFEFV